MLLRNSKHERTRANTSSSHVHSTDQLQAAIDNESVNLVHWVDANYLMQATDGKSNSLVDLTARLEDAFKKCEDIKEIKGVSLFHYFRSGVVLTDTGKLYTYYDSQNPAVNSDIERLLWGMEGFSQETEELLQNEAEAAARGNIGRKLYELTLHLMYAVDEAIANADVDGDRIPRAIALVRGEFELARSFRDRIALRVAQRHYFRGMLLGGIALLVLVAGCVGGLLYAADISPTFIRYSLASLAAGGLGAVLSVLQRMTSGKLDLDIYADEKSLKRVGAIRPIVGALFGFILFAAIEGEVIRIAPRDETRIEFFFYCTIAFIAGFNERWAQDMLGRSAQAVQKKDEEKAEVSTPGSVG
jgi:hypothetical protein